MMSLDMGSETRTAQGREQPNPKLSNGFSSEFPDQYTLVEVWRAQRPKDCDNNNKDGDNILNIK